MNLLPMTRQQYEREKILRMKAEVESGRERELRLLAEARRDADPRYVQNVVALLWRKILDRKVAKRNSLRSVERERLKTLMGIMARPFAVWHECKILPRLPL
jgi:hypothetical protein